MAGDRDELLHLGTEAIGPCAVCDRVMLASGAPLFYRIRIRQCGIDRVEVQRHVGLAMSIAPGADGLALAGVLGPDPKPALVINEFEINLCHDCSITTSFNQLLAAAMEKSGG